jgi:hypothetical protein
MAMVAARGGPPLSLSPVAALRLGFLGAFLSVSNHAAMVGLRKQLAAGALVVADQGRRLSRLEDTVESVEGAVMEQDASIAVLRAALSEHQERMNSALDTFASSLDAQRRQLASQCETLERLVTSRFQRDALVDALVAFMSWAAVSMPFVTVPARAVTSLVAALPQPGGRQAARVRAAWLASASRVFAFVLVFRALRARAAAAGLHYRVGTPQTYAAALTAAATRAASAVLATAQRLAGGGAQPAAALCCTDGGEIAMACAGRANVGEPPFDELSTCSPPLCEPPAS